MSKLDCWWIVTIWLILFGAVIAHVVVIVVGYRSGFMVVLQPMFGRFRAQWLDNKSQD